jgi:hypothetical protein
MGFYDEKLKQYIDPDKDEAAVSVLASDRIARRKKLSEALQEKQK